MKKYLFLLFFVSISTSLFGMEDNTTNEGQRIHENNHSDNENGTKTKGYASNSDGDENNTNEGEYCSDSEKETYTKLETKFNNLLHTVSDIKDKYNKFVKKIENFIVDSNTKMSQFGEEQRELKNFNKNCVKVLAETGTRLTDLDKQFKNLQTSCEQSEQSCYRLENCLSQLQAPVTILQPEQETQHKALYEKIDNVQAQYDNKLNNLNIALQKLENKPSTQDAINKGDVEDIIGVQTRLIERLEVLDEKVKSTLSANKELTPWLGYSRYAMQGVGTVLGAGLFATMVPSTIPLFLLPFAKVGIGAAATKIGIGTTMGLTMLGAHKYNQRCWNIEKTMKTSIRSIPTWSAWSQDTISLLAKPALYTFSACTIGLMAYQLRKNPIILPNI